MGLHKEFISKDANVTDCRSELTWGVTHKRWDSTVSCIDFRQKLEVAVMLVIELLELYNQTPEPALGKALQQALSE